MPVKPLRANHSSREPPAGAMAESAEKEFWEGAMSTRQRAEKGPFRCPICQSPLDIGTLAAKVRFYVIFKKGGEPVNTIMECTRQELGNWLNEVPPGPLRAYPHADLVRCCTRVCAESMLRARVIAM